MHRGVSVQEQDIIIQSAALRTEVLFGGPVGVIDGTAREISGEIRVIQCGNVYSVAGTRFEEVKTSELHNIIITSGRAVVDIDDTAPAEPLSIHRVSGFTDLSCGDRTAIIISGHTGFNALDGMVSSGRYTSPEGADYTVVIPEGRTWEDTSWVGRVVRVNQVSGYVNISRKKHEVGPAQTASIAYAGKIAVMPSTMPSVSSTPQTR